VPTDTDPADLTVTEAVELLQRRELSSRELTGACLRRIEQRNGCSPGATLAADSQAINAWVRVDADAAMTAAGIADERLATGEAPPLCGVPIGLKDLYSVAGWPLTASSALLEEHPTRDSDVWQRLATAGMVLIGHTHTHEFAAGGTTDQVGNPWSLAHSAGGSSGGSAAAVAAAMVPATTGTDTAGSLRIPSALTGVSTIKPTRGLVSIAGIVPLAPTLDHAGPIARTVADCAVLLAAMAGPDSGDAVSAFARLDREAAINDLDGLKLGLSPRLAAVSLDADVADGLSHVIEVLTAAGVTIVVPAQPAPAEVAGEQLALLTTEMLDFHARFNDRRSDYQPSTRQLLEYGERTQIDAVGYMRLQQQRRETTRAWHDWLAASDVAAVLEPTVPVTAPLRGTGYERMGDDAALVSLTYLWCWTGMPVVSLPAGVGARTGLPVGVSLIGAAGSDARLLRLGAALQGMVGYAMPAGGGDLG
jgi:aspartyl-tRNA(Asn)/glutamyl-tRNA(Gln) amidotransferase subunit A